MDGQSVMIIGQEKGNDTNSRIKRNFGMARPEGYRKSIRLMNLANKFSLPILTFVDTAGAYPGVGAEQRGQSEAIASSIKTCLSVDVPLISIIIGEGLSLIHISEPTRPNEISYAVFCLKKIFFNDTATTEIYTETIVGSVRCV